MVERMNMVRITLTLPEEMLEVLKERKRQVGIPVNTQIQRDIEAGIMDRAHAQAKVRDADK